MIGAEANGEFSVVLAPVQSPRTYSPNRPQARCHSSATFLPVDLPCAPSGSLPAAARSHT